MLRLDRTNSFKALCFGRVLFILVTKQGEVMKINVLGTEYNVIDNKTEYLKEINADGEHREYEKTITIRKLNDFLGCDSSPEEKEARKREVLRHEIIHAFFSESGLDNYNVDEQLVNWLAIQFPKMQKAFKEANCL